MADDPEPRDPSAARVTAAELAALVGDPVERVEELTGLGVLVPDDDGLYRPGDTHRIRVVDGFEAAGVPLNVLVEAQDAGVISVAYYDELHAPPGRPSGRPYGAFRDSVATGGDLLPAIFAAFGVAEPDPDSKLTLEDEAFLERVASLVRDTAEVDLMLRGLRQFGEATRRASLASLEVYAEVIERLDPAFAGVPSPDVYDQHFLPWARVARSLPMVAEWLTRKHMTQAIDDYSIQATEVVLETRGYVSPRRDAEPAAAFLDLTGFTSLAQQQGDTIAADVALRLGDLASRTAVGYGGRLVKLLGDGVLMRFPNIVAAVEASLDVLDLLPSSGLPPGHVGVTRGPIIARDGDVFGRTVNLAARISDVAPSGELYVPASSGSILAERFRVESIGPVAVPGIGDVELARVARR